MKYKIGDVLARCPGTHPDVEKEWRLPVGSLWRIRELTDSHYIVDEIPDTGTGVPRTWLESNSFMRLRPLDGGTAPPDYLAHEVRRLNPEQRARFWAALGET